MGRERKRGERGARDEQATDETSNNREDDETTGTEDDGKVGMDTWHGTWLKSRTCPLSGASEHKGYGATAQSRNRHNAKSQSFSADKGNQKPGIGGKRVTHAYCRRRALSL